MQVNKEFVGVKMATPTTPASGYSALYFKSDGLLYTLNDAGLESLAGSAVGASHDYGMDIAVRNVQCFNNTFS